MAGSVASGVGVCIGAELFGQSPLLYEGREFDQAYFPRHYWPIFPQIVGTLGDGEVVVVIVQQRVVCVCCVLVEQSGRCCCCCGRRVLMVVVVVVVRVVVVLLVRRVLVVLAAIQLAIVTEVVQGLLLLLLLEMEVVVVAVLAQLGQHGGLGGGRPLNCLLVLGVQVGLRVRLAQCCVASQMVAQV